MRRLLSITVVLVLFSGGVPKLHADTVAFSGPELLGKPTDQSITINIVPDATIEYYYEYGISSGTYTDATSPVTATGGQPHEVVITGLSPNTRYYYRMIYDGDGDVDDGDYEVRAEHTFHTQRAEGEEFVFTIISDTHAYWTASDYQQAVANVQDDDPDFHLDLGDTQMTDNDGNQSQVNDAYLLSRSLSNMGGIGQSAPIFTMPGNHENEEGWNLDDSFSPALASIQARKWYFPTPNPNDDPFYTSNTDILTDIDAGTYGDQYREDYYAWEWGDALFVVFDPFQYTMQNPYGNTAGEGSVGDNDPATGDRWNWTLGQQQYNWLKGVLEEHKGKKYKFMFAHHMVGGEQNYVREGATPAHMFEWGGYDADGTTWGWTTKRPAWEDDPIRQLMIDNGVSAFFHGHDHQYAYQVRDGIVYQCLPQPTTSMGGFNYYSESDPYTERVISNSGHLRVTVSPTETTVEYVRSNQTGVSHTYTIAPNPIETGLTVTINQASGQDDPTNTSPINFTVEFSEAVTGFETGDVNLSSSTTLGTLIGTVTGSGTTYNVAVSGMTGSGDVIASIDAGVAVDAATGTESNVASSSTDNEVVYDVTAPTVTLNQAFEQVDPTDDAPINFTVVFNEPVVDFVTGDVTLEGPAGATTATVTESAPNDGTTYNVAVSGMTASGTVIASIVAGVAQDAAGNPNEASTSTDNQVTYNLDTTDPTVTIDQASGQADPTDDSPVSFTVVFSEAVADFTTGDVNLSSSTAPGTLTGTVTGSGTTYNVAVSGMTGSGDVIASIDAGVAHDGAGNPNEASSSADNQVTYNLDTTDPTVTINQASGQADPTDDSPVNFTVVFSEAVADFATGDVNLSSSTAPGTLTGTVTGSGTTYNVAVSGMTGSGDVIASIDAGVAHDEAGNPNEGSTSSDNEVTFEYAASPLSLDGAVSSGTADDVSSINISHTTGTGTDRLMLVGVSWNCGTTDRTISSVTFTPSGGSALGLTEVITQLGYNTSNPRYSAVYRLLNPTSGQSGTVTITFSGSVSNGIVAGVANFAGVHQTTPLGTPNGAGTEDSDDAPTVTLTGLNGDELVFDNVFMGASSSSQTLTAGAGQTELWTDFAGNTRASASTEQATGSSVTMSWTAASTGRWAIAAVPIRPASSVPTMPSYNIVLGRPTNNSITVNTIVDRDGEVSYEYGTESGTYGTPTSAVSCTNGEPVEVVISGLASNTQYFYRLRFRDTGATEWLTGDEHSFHTQRAQGSTFTFTIISDSHLGQTFSSNDPDRYEAATLNVADDEPDFHVDLGDAFIISDDLGVGSNETGNQSQVDAVYLGQRPYFGNFSHSAPVFLAIGNHENEEGWNLDDTPFSRALASIKARKQYFPNPVPDAFYSGNDDELAAIGGDQLREDYYAWTWGDALFVVLDPFQYTMIKPYGTITGSGEDNDETVSGDQWNWTLGQDQFDWFKETLESSTAKYKLVFSHHVVGGILNVSGGAGTPEYVRGGAVAAPYFEWGGNNANDTWGFDTERSGWGADPIHQLMIDNHVSAFFHGHDHQFVHEEIDDIVYQLVPSASMTGYGFDLYGDSPYVVSGGNLPNAGHLRVTVTSDETTVEYVRSAISGDGVTNGVVSHSYTILPNISATYDLTMAVDPVGGGTTDPAAGEVHTYSEGTVVTITATPADGYVFDYWEGDVADPDETSTTVTMNGDKTVTAHFTVETPPGILGDVNGNEVANSTDALIVLSCDVGIDASAFCPMNCGDVNSDGVVNSTDALIILSYDAGMSVSFPVGEPGCPSDVTPCAGCSP